MTVLVQEKRFDFFSFSFNVSMYLFIYLVSIICLLTSWNEARADTNAISHGCGFIKVMDIITINNEYEKNLRAPVNFLK